MTPSTRRAFLALLAWPVGIVGALAGLVLTSPSCPPGEACALAPVPVWLLIILFVIAVGPGGLATMLWWRRRGSAG